VAIPDVPSYDDKYYKNFLYFFTLEIPKEAHSFGMVPISAQFPLLINPQTYTVSDPFTVSVTPTLGGGVFVEENGVLVRQISLTGVTGFTPRRMKGTAFQVQDHALKDTIHYSPFRAPAPIPPLALSGQAQFFNLQDRCFRLYGDLKRNPQTADGTRMFWHNVKDGEAWRVIPLSFRLVRATPRSTLYRYQIELLGIELKEQVDLFGAIEDQSWSDLILSPFRKLQSWVDSANGAINTVTAYVNEFENTVRSIRNSIESISSIIDNVTNVVDAVTDAAQGVTDLIAAPARLLTNVSNSIENLLDSIEEAGLVATDFTQNGKIPMAYLQSWSNIKRTMEQSLAEFPERFETTYEARLRALSARARRATSDGEAANSSYAKHFSGLASSGSAVQPGDAQTDRGRGTPGDSVVPAARSFVARSLPAHVNTIHEAAKELLGNSTRWRELAMLNGLAYPYISRAGVPGTIKPGDTLLIPSDQPPRRDRGPLAILGVPPDAPKEERFWGTDFKLKPLEDTNPQVGPRGGYDLEANGSGNDFLLVKGEDNLVQGITTRVITEQGSSALYSDLGVPAAIGSVQPFLEEEAAKTSFQRAVLVDPRISSVTNVRLLARSSPDTLQIEMDAVALLLEDKTTVPVSTTVRKPVGAVAYTPL
jgi:hypothetical protein